jgi:hypothetical protein
LSQVRQTGIEPTRAEKSALFAIYDETQHFVRTSPVEPRIVSIIKTMQDIGIPVIGLTARAYSIRHQTLNQLADIGVDFSLNSIIPDDKLSCQGGIIFCNGGNKGDYLTSVFSKLRYIPHHVVMLDDKRKHLESVKTALGALETELKEVANYSKLKLHFSGFRYGYLDKVGQQFSMEDANKQLAHIWNCLSSTVKKDIKNLKLLPEALMDIPCPLVCTENFFHPDHPLYPIAKTPLDEQPKALKRSDSIPSFFMNKTLPIESKKEQSTLGIHSTT